MLFSNFPGVTQTGSSQMATQVCLLLDNDNAVLPHGFAFSRLMEKNLTWVSVLDQVHEK